MMAAVLAEDETSIDNAAMEPEIVICQIFKQVGGRCKRSGN